MHLLIVNMDEYYFSYIAQMRIQLGFVTFAMTILSNLVHRDCVTEICHTEPLTIDFFSFLSKIFPLHFHNSSISLSLSVEWLIKAWV